jgi:NADPH:quinone reductase-like Zn-dependent oxidoreductase
VGEPGPVPADLPDPVQEGGIPDEPAHQERRLFLRQLIEAGTYHALIDWSYPLEQAAGAARYVETQQKTGNVVLTVEG